MSNQLILVAAGLLFLGLLGVLAFALNAATPGGGSNVSKQLSVYTLARGKAKKRSREPTAFGESTIAQTAVDFAGRITAKRGFEEWLQQRLEAAANPLKPAEWILLQADHRPAAAAVRLRRQRQQPDLDARGGSLCPRARVRHAEHPRQPQEEEVRGRPLRHPPADGRQPERRVLTSASCRQRGPRRRGPDLHRVQPRPGRDPARCPDRGRPRDRRRPDAEQGLRLGRHGHPDPARGRRQPGGAAPDGRGNAAGARATAATSTDLVGGGSPVGLDPRRPSGRLHALPAHRPALATSSRWARSRWAGS